MAITYENMTSIIPNATMQKMYINGVHKTYIIAPNDGYVMHDTARDFTNYQTVVDEITGEETTIEIPMLGYGGDSSCGYAYEFTPIEMQDEAGNTVTAYGSRQFYCKLATDVPADQIFGVVDTPEVM